MKLPHIKTGRGWLSIGLELKYVFYQGVAGQLGERDSRLNREAGREVHKLAGTALWFFGLFAIHPGCDAAPQFPIIWLTTEKGKSPLVVVDGLALDQWLVIKTT